MTSEQAVRPAVARPSGTVTFLFTDIEGSTRMWEEASNAMRDALAHHDSILRNAVAAHQGVIFSTGGDGVAAAFAGAANGVMAALDAQRALQAHDWPENAELRVRMGLHSGEAHERDGDYFGPPVNRASRVMALACGGQVVMSSTTSDLVGPAPGIERVELGSVDLKGIGESVLVVGVWTEGVEWLDRPLSSATARAPTIPLPASEWFGPTEELVSRAAELPNRRLVSIVGAGGMGKTRTAVELGHLLADEYSDGVWMVELAAVREPESLLSSVATALMVRPQPGTPSDALIDWLGSRRGLLIMDNCEHIAAAAAELISLIVRRCPRITVLATSRERLGVEGERVISVPNLDRGHIVALFCDRALSVDDSLVFSETDLEIVASICERLDGIPLAVELAASRLRTLSLTELHTRLRDRFRVLRETTPAQHERHATLHAAVDWSYQLLPEDDRLLFERLSVFAGWFDLGASEAVAGDLDIDVLEALPDLVEKSLVVADRRGSVGRFRLLDTLREFARARLEARGSSALARERHVNHYIAVSEAASRRWRSPQQLEADAVFDSIWAELRVALARSCDADDLASAERIVAASLCHAQLRVRDEHAEWSENTISLDRTDRPVGAATLAWAGWWGLSRGDPDHAIARASVALERATTPTDIVVASGTLGFAYWSSGRAPESEAPLGVMREHLGDVDLWTELMALRALVGVIEPETRRLGARMAALADQLGAPAMIASARFYQGLGASDADAAVALYLEGVRLSRAANANLAECQNLQGLQSTAAGRGHPQALRYCHDSLVRIYELRYWLHLWRVVAGAAKMLADRGDIETAGTIAGHLKEHHFAWGDATTKRIVRSTLAVVENHPDGPSLMRAGATADREQIVQLTIEAIERAMEAEASVSARLGASLSSPGRRGVRDRFRRGAQRWSAAAVEELGRVRVDDPATEPPSPLD